MSVVVVATLTPKRGKLQELQDALATTVPLVHAEPGCELYAAHTDGTVVIMVERWASPEALDTHSKADALKRFAGLPEGVLAEPIEVKVLENIPLGEATKGTIQ